MKPEWNKFWEKIFSIVEVNFRQECDVLAYFLINLDNYSRVLLLSGSLKFPFQNSPVTQSDVLSQFPSINYIKLGTDLLPQVP